MDRVKVTTLSDTKARRYARSCEVKCCSTNDIHTTPAKGGNFVPHSHKTAMKTQSHHPRQIEYTTHAHGETGIFKAFRIISCAWTYYISIPKTNSCQCMKRQMFITGQLRFISRMNSTQNDRHACSETSYLQGG